MNWSRFRSFSITFGASLGVLLGVTLVSFGSGAWWRTVVLLLILIVIVLNLLLTRHWNGSVVETTAQRARLIATGQAPGESAPARVHAVLGQRFEQVSTMLAPGNAEPGQLLLMHVLPAAAAPRTVYATVPVRYGITRGAPAAVVLDPANPDIAVFDDRVTAETLSAIAADPRWLTMRVPGMFARQGGAATIAATCAGLVLALVIGVLLG